MAKAKHEIVDIVKSEFGQLKDSALADRWEDFFERFQQGETDPEGKWRLSKPYIDQILQMGSLPPIVYGDPDSLGLDYPLGRRIFQIDYDDLVYAKTDMLGIYDKRDDKEAEDEPSSREIDIKILCYGIRNDWQITEAAIKQAVFSLLRRNNKGYADILERNQSDLIVTITNFEITKPMMDIGSEDLDKFVRIKGVISEFDDQQSLEIVRMAWKCASCKLEQETKNRKAPPKCANCDSRILDEVPGKAKTQDFMYFVLQDPQEVLKEGQLLPPSRNIYVGGTDLVRSAFNCISIGKAVAVDGVARMTELIRGNTTVAGVEIECHGIEIVNENPVYNERLREEVSREIPPDEIDDHYDKLKRSIAPYLEGLEEQKETILLTLAGSPPVSDRQGDRVRGEIQAIFIGDTSTGKTALLKFARAVNKSAIYVQGQLASKVGLTASIRTTEVLRAGSVVKKTSLSAGVYGMASKPGSLICLDELSKVSSPEHYEAMSSAMDDHGKMFVHKNVAHAEISVHCASLHAANPITNQGKYDVRKDVLSQTNFASWLWSRYDLKWLHVAHRDDVSRHLLWQRKAESFSNMELEGFDDDALHYHKRSRAGDTFSVDYLWHEMVFLRENYNPKLEPGKLPWIMMMKFWNWYNDRNIVPTRDALEKDELMFVPMLDERAINSIIRLAQAAARLHRRNTVTVTDMSIALNLMKVSIAQFIPKIDESDDELRAAATGQIAISEGLKRAVEEANRTHGEFMQNFIRGMLKGMNHLHRRLFRKCEACRGSGTMQQGETGADEMIRQFGDPAHIRCHSCLGTRGSYEPFTYLDYRQYMAEAKVSPYAETYFKIFRKAKVIERESGAENVMSAIDANPSFSGIWHIKRDLTGNVSLQMTKIANELLGPEFGQQRSQ